MILMSNVMKTITVMLMALTSEDIGAKGEEGHWKQRTRGQGWKVLLFFNIVCEIIVIVIKDIKVTRGKIDEKYDISHHPSKAE